MNSRPPSVPRRNAVLHGIVYEEAVPHTANIGVPLRDSVHLLTRLQHELPRRIVAEGDPFEVPLDAQDSDHAPGVRGVSVGQQPEFDSRSVESSERPLQLDVFFEEVFEWECVVDLLVEGHGIYLVVVDQALDRGAEFAQVLLVQGGRLLGWHV